MPQIQAQRNSKILKDSLFETKVSELNATQHKRL